MPYKTHYWYCSFCNCELKSMGVANHRRGKKHIANVNKKEQKGSIFRLD